MSTKIEVPILNYQIMGTALVTGAARGIGWNFSKRFAADGHDLVLVDVDKKQLEESANILTDLYGTKIRLIVKDLTKFNSSIDFPTTGNLIPLQVMQVTHLPSPRLTRL